MPKVCEPCGFYSDDDAPKSCPTCGCVLRYSFLPPVGPAGGRASGGSSSTATAPARPQQKGFLDSLNVDPRVLVLGGLALVGLIGFTVFQSRTREESKGIQPGMHISQALRLIDTTNGPEQPFLNRLRERTGPDDVSSGWVEHDDGRVRVIIHWEKGIVTKIENKGESKSGGSKQQSAETDAGDDSN
jgi:hypothetical protein